MAKVIGLAAIVAATHSAAGFAWVPAAEAAVLVQDGTAEVNSELKDPSKKGRLATRATQKGIDSMGTAQAQAAAPAATEAAKPSFVIESNVAIPAVSGRGRAVGGSIYPFDKLEVGQSFFVPKEAKKLASTVSSANARFAEVIEGQTKVNRKGATVPATKFTRQFIVRSVTEAGVTGSRIWRKA